MKHRISSLIAILLLLNCTTAWSQDARGTIVGKITDASGAILTNASVVVTNEAMGTRLALTTNAGGAYLAPLLSPGLYSIEVTAPGFKTALRKGVEVRVGDRIDISLVLEVGASEQSVTVTGDVRC